MDARLHRHVEACNDLASPAGFLPFRLGDRRVGWVAPEVVRCLTFRPREVHFDGGGVSLASRLRGAGARSAALESLVGDLARTGLARRRDEAFDVREAPGGPSLATLDRGALTAFGVMSEGVHVNGIVRRADGPHLWMGWRARDKSVAPGKLDNLVAGGIPAGLDAERTLVKEAGEEASLPPELALRARPVGRVSYVMREGAGMRRDLLHLYDLDLPEDFAPAPGDDEVERFELMPMARVLEVVRETDWVKFNVNLVLIHLFLREGLVEDPNGTLRAGLDQVA